MKYKLYDYQKEAVEFHLKKRYSINAFYMGLGKTLVAIDFADKIGEETLIVCPGYLRKNWQDEINKFSKDPSIYTIVSYSSFKKIDSIYYTIVMDEAHYIKTPKAQRSKRIEKHLKEKPPLYMLLMTGTPAKNNVGEIYNLIHFIRLLTPVEGMRFINQIKFNKYFMFERTFKIRGRRITKYEGARNMPELQKIISPILLRKKAGQVKLPPIINKKIVGETVKFDKIFKIDKEDEKAFMTLKKEVALHSTSATLSLIEDFPKDEQIVIFTEHVQAAEKLGTALKVTPITGKVSEEKRFSLIDRFKAKEDQYLVMTYKTGSTGHTLTNCNYMVFNDLPFVPADLEQAKKRIHRIGQDKSCFYYYMFVSKFFEDTYAKLLRKSKFIKELD